MFFFNFWFDKLRCSEACRCSSLHLQVRENCKCVYAKASIIWGLCITHFILWNFVHCIVSHVFLPSLCVMPSLQSLPWLCNQCWGSSCPHLVPVGTNCTTPLLAFFSSHRPSVAESSPGNAFHYNGEERGNLEFCIRKWLCPVFWFELHFMT